MFDVAVDFCMNSSNIYVRGDDGEMIECAMFDEIQINYSGDEQQQQIGNGIA